MRKNANRNPSGSTGLVQRLCRLAVGVTAAGIVLVSMLTPQSASAQALYFGGANVNPSTTCNADQHTLGFTMTMVKDARFSTQSYQFQYRLTNLATGQAAYLGPFTRNVYSNGDVHYWSVGGAMIAGARFHVDYTVRFGTLNGYNAWSAWTPTGHLQTWGKYYWWNTPSSICYT